MDEIMQWKRECPFTFASKPNDHMKPQEVTEELDKQLSLGKDGKWKEQTVITTGVGQHQM